MDLELYIEKKLKGKSSPCVLIIGTLDTKGPEISYLKKRIEEEGVSTVVLDSGILGQPVDIIPDISREIVAKASGSTLEDIRNIGIRGPAVEQMLKGVSVCSIALHKLKICHGVISLGGAEGAILASAGMQVLPVGIPKLIVSPLAAGKRQFGPFIGIRDVMIMHSVIDILGLNSVSRLIFDQAAGAISGMVKAMTRSSVNEKASVKTVGITMLGNTTKAVERIQKAIEAKGFEAIIFHSSGVGGAAMEEMIKEGRIGSVIDFTCNELTDHLVGGFHDAGENRLEAAGNYSCPQVIVPGCVDFFCQGAPKTIPEKWKNRPSYYHNPSFTLIRTSRKEMLQIAEIMAKKLNKAKAAVNVLIPIKGLSIPNREGDVFYDSEGDELFRERLKEKLDNRISVKEIDAHINDEKFSTVVCEAFFTLIE